MCYIISIVATCAIIHHIAAVVDVLKKTFLSMGKLAGSVNLMRHSIDNRENTNRHCSPGMLQVRILLL